MSKHPLDTQLTLPGLPEDVLIEFICNQPQLSNLDMKLHHYALDLGNRGYQEFEEIVKQAVGSSLTSLNYDKLVWSYIASFWWDFNKEERELRESAKVLDNKSDTYL